MGFSMGSSSLHEIHEILKNLLAFQGHYGVK